MQGSLTTGAAGASMKNQSEMMTTMNYSLDPKLRGETDQDNAGYFAFLIQMAAAA